MKNSLAFLIVIGLSQPSFALTCTGKISKIETLSGGLVRLTSTSGIPTKSYICSANGGWKNISTETCQAWVSYAHIAQTTGQNLEVTYTNTTATRCSNLPINSKSISPYSIGIKK
jgi:hypothetical protein